MDRERGSLCPSGSHPRAGVPNGDGPAPIVGVGKCGARRRPPGPFSGWVRRALTAAVGLVLASGGAVGVAGAAGGVGSATVAGPPLILVSQTPVVMPAGSFDLELRAGTGTPPASQLGVSVSVYPCLSSVSAFDQSVSTASGPSGTPIDATRSPLAVSGLPVAASGGFGLTMPVYVGHGVTAPAGQFAIDLPNGGGQCGNAPSGVYPVRVQLVDTTSGQSVGGFTTHLVFTETPASTVKLRVAVVLPIATTVTAATATGTAELTTRPGAALAEPPAAATSALTATVATIAQAHPSVPVTLQASPQTVAGLATTGHQSTVAQLEALADSPSVHELTSAPYVPVDASALVGAGLASELDLQVSRGSQVLAAYLPRPATSPASSAWITGDGVDAATLSQLETDGFNQLVVPAASVPEAPTNGSAAEPFQLSPQTGAPVSVVAANADLASRFAGDPGNPVLAASELVAELAQIYFEKPNDTAPRIVAAVAPNGWADDPSFVGALLGDLDGNPVVEPVTTAALFTAVSTSPCHTTCRSVAAPGGAGLPATAIRAQRQRIGGLVGATSTPAARAVTTQLGDLVLAGESERLRPSQQTGVLHNTDLAVNAQLGQLQVAGDQSITLTSQRGRVPVTIVSDAPYPVTATLTLTSDKLLFPDGQSLTNVVLLPTHTNNVYVNVETRASGLFKVGVTLYSPTGGVTLASGQVSVRSTATSVVGIVLSAGAVAVLVVWWFRTSRKRRAARRRRPDGDEADDETDAVVTAGQP